MTTPKPEDTNNLNFPAVKQSGPDFNETTNLKEGTWPTDSTTRTDPELWVGRRLGKYEILGVLGVGGMGVVLRGHDASIERDVAIKVLPVEFSSDKVAMNRFLAEAKSSGKLNHPNVVTIYEVGQHELTHFLVMEIVAAGSAESFLKKDGPFTVNEATRITIETCQGLAAAHKESFVHRDIKPANLLLTENLSVKISDFGLAKRTQGNTLQMTQEGQMVGTPYYMSPEQCESKTVDARSDIYSLGATYYSLLTGKFPYADSASVMQVMFAHFNKPPPDPRLVLPQIPAECAQVIQRAMAKNPTHRYKSADEMKADLENLLGKGSPTIGGQTTTSIVKPFLTQGPIGGPKKRLMVGLVAGIAIGFVGLLFTILAFSGVFSGDHTTSPPTKSLSAGPVAPGITPPTGEPIKVGILHSLSGTMLASESPVVDATLLAIDEINKKGGLLGRPVEAVIVDGRSDPTAFAKGAIRLVKEEKVSSVFGCWTSASRKTVVPIFEEGNNLLIYPVQYEGIEESPNVIYTGAAPNQQIIPAVQWAYITQKRRRFFLVGSDYVFPRVANVIIKDQLKILGADVVGEEYIPLGEGDVSAIITKIQASKPDVILNTLNGDSNWPFFAGLRKAGFTPEKLPTISFSIGEEELRHIDVSTMAGDFAAWNYFQSLESPENVEFVTNFRTKYGQQRLVTDPMEAAYIGVKLWAMAVQESGKTDAAEIRRAMRNLQIKAPEGDVRIDAGTQHTYKLPRIGKVLATGQFEVVWTAAKPEAPQPYPISRTAEQWRALLHDLYTGWGNQWAAPKK